MVQVRHFLILIPALTVLGCSKATPTFDLLDEGMIPQPQFSGSTTKNLTTTSASQTFTINGQCDVKISSIRVQVADISNAYTALSDYTVGAPTVTCSSNGTFAFELKSLSALGFTTFYEGKEFEIRLRGMTSAGLSRPSLIKIKFSTGMGNKNIRLAGGGVHGAGTGAFRAEGNGFKAEIYLNHVALKFNAANHPTDGTFVLRTGNDSN